MQRFQEEKRVKNELEQVKIESKKLDTEIDLASEAS